MFSLSNQPVTTCSSPDEIESLTETTPSKTVRCTVETGMSATPLWEGISMVRETVRSEVLYGHYMDALEICGELNKLCEAKGLSIGRLRAPLGGKANVLIAESEYDSLAEYERQSGV